jgi:DNA polymerase III alpha subunit (gram-positive type)
MEAFLFDTETDGLVANHTLKLARQPCVIEFYGCSADLKTGKILHELNFLIKSPQPISAEITTITTITNEMLKDAPPFSIVADKIFTAIENAPVVIAHNLSFDKEMLDLEAERLGRKIAWPRLICSVEQSIAMKGYRLSLSNLHQELFGEPFEGAHRAKADVKALLRCCVELWKKGIL